MQKIYQYIIYIIYKLHINLHFYLLSNYKKSNNKKYVIRKDYFNLFVNINNIFILFF